MDLDKTLLREDKSISPYTIAVLEKIKEKGLVVAIATARPRRTANQYISSIGGDAAVYLNGAIICKDGDITNSFTIPRSDVVDIIGIIKENYSKATISVEMNDTLYADFNLREDWDYKYIDFNDLPDKPAEKIIIGNIDLHEVRELNRIICDGFYAECNSSKFIMIMNSNASKAKAVRIIAGDLGLSMSEIAAFGDDYNDIVMLRECGLGIAMGNACYQAKAYSDFITKTNENDGVAYFIDEYLL